MSAEPHRPAWDLKCCACPCFAHYVEGFYSAAELMARGWFWTRLEVRCRDCSVDQRAELAHLEDEAIRGAVEDREQFDENDEKDLTVLHERLGREPSEDERERFLDLLTLAREQLDETDMSDVPPCERPEYAPHW